MNDEKTCINGHANPSGNLHCGTCGAPLDERPPATADPLEGGPGLADDAVERTSSRRTLALVWGGIAVIAVVIAAIVMAQGRGSDESDSTDYADEDIYENTTTTPSIESMCEEELTSWLEYVTGPGGSVMDGAAEYGLQSPSFVLLREVWATFQGAVYQVGVDDASAQAQEQLAIGCATLGETYEPGHMAPG